jgi:hypothetical protein
MAGNGRRFFSAGPLVILGGVAIVINSGALRHSRFYVSQHASMAVQAGLGGALILIGIWFYYLPSNDEDDNTLNESPDDKALR